MNAPFTRRSAPNRYAAGTVEGGDMSARTVVIWLVVVAAFVGATYAFRGEGHRMLAKLASFHGSR
jgi:hypothetical protein